MKAHDIRLTFLDYFSRRGHRVVSSSSLLPKDDPTLLFTNAGMNQFKNVFLGLEQRSYKRAATVQKCLRVSGKHNDLEEVGRTTKHHTFFEMLGNFSFGDYFKSEAVAFAWELVTDVFRLPAARLYVTVYEEDEEAFRLWTERVGVPAARVFRFGKKDNYWSMGDTGPCGPCSEIHYDLGPDIEPGDPRALIESGSERLVELWNLVFMQFDQGADGGLRPLPSPSIDTGMGLERMAAALQGRRSNFETDLFLPLLERVADASEREYPAGDESDVAVRVIADHLRAVTFLLGDGIMPSNDGRGYVLRRLIRRAFRRGNLLGLDKPFLFRLTGTVVDVMKDAYPELLGTAAFISKICLSEEERFAATLSSGMRMFGELAGRAKGEGRAALTGAEVFRLYDTLGFPPDLTMELAREEGLGVDEPDFREELDRQRRRARETWKGGPGTGERKAYEPFLGTATLFMGHDLTRLEGARVTGLIRQGERTPALEEGQSGEVILDRTPFYAEAGGQAGDTGVLKNARFSARVEASYFPVPDIVAHKVAVLSGRAAEGDEVEAAVDEERRLALRRNHTATHLLHAALRQVLGEHVRQAGSLVLPERLRFDYTHFAPLSTEETRKVERLVNEVIREDVPVETKIMTLEEGIRSGAMAIFEEKYGDRVRLVSVADFSRELCGGVHSSSTGRLGLFKIIGQESVAAGMRRIEAVTGDEALAEIQSADALIEEVQAVVSAPRRDLAEQVRRLKDEARAREKEVRLLRRKLAAGEFGTAGETVRSIKGVKLLTRRTEGLNAGEVRDLADSLKQRLGSGVVLIGQVEGEKVLLVSAVSKDLTSRIRADRLVKELAGRVGGGGGGRADFAQAGGHEPGRLDELLERSSEVLEQWL